MNCMSTDLVLVGQAIFLLEREKQSNKHTDRQTDTTERPTPRR